MIRLEASNLLVRWFVWCCDHLPATTGYLLSEKPGAESGPAKTGAWYVENGTTLCHLFWACLWVPLLGTAFVGFVLLMVIMVHVEGHYEFVAKNPDSNPVLQVAAYFFPEVFLLAGILAVGIIALAVIGGSKTGFFSLLWQYLKGLKNRVCPLVKFEAK
jgi:hypothetical protein